MASLLLPCTESAVEFLRREGLEGRAHLVGDPMYDAFLYYGSRITERDRNALIGLDGAPVPRPARFYYLTCHRQENTDTDEKLEEILIAMNSLDAVTVYPVHPRNQKRAAQIQQKLGLNHILLVQPVGYLTSISLVNGAEKIVTDSGGLQREAFFAEKQCVTVFEHVVWPETMTANRNQLSRPERGDILKKLSTVQAIDPAYKPFGDGTAGEKICSCLCASILPL